MFDSNNLFLYFSRLAQELISLFDGNTIAMLLSEPLLADMLRVWRRTRLGLRRNLLASAFSSSSANGASDEDSEEAATAAPPKYDHVRKLIVGLGNPGDKFTNTR
jgi:hypothetical protein